MNSVKERATVSDVLDHLVDQGLLSRAQIESEGLQQAPSLRALFSAGLVPELAMAKSLSKVFTLDLLSAVQFPNSALEQTKDLTAFFSTHEVLPISLSDNVMTLAMTDPSDEFALKALKSKLKCEIRACIALRSDLLEALNRLYSTQRNIKATASLIDIPTDLGNEAGLVRDLHRLIQRAVSSNASDIHFEPVQSALRVRFRVHGVMREAYKFDASLSDQVIARLKLMAKLDVTERRHAQNGRFKFPADGRVIDLRVSSLPLHDGESIVLRLLEFNLSQESLESLGFRSAVALRLDQLLMAQSGLILVTGPTGSGKSTTLYSMLNTLNSTERKVISIEDPVELNIDGVNQIQINEEYGLGFSEALKTVLRQDPDVIMVGEIRDTETAQLAAQAALTGHLVLATLHTESAISALSRLKHLGLADYLIKATLRASVAQRLLRTVCTVCDADRSQCDSCSGRGFTGRTTIAEMLDLTGVQSFELDDLQQHLLDDMSLADDAVRLLESGQTNRGEVQRVLGLDAQI